MSNTFNVMGPAQKVSDLIKHFKSANGIVMNSFPTRPDLRDVNVKIPDDRVDEFNDWCEKHGLKCELV